MLLPRWQSFCPDPRPSERDSPQSAYFCRCRFRWNFGQLLDHKLEQAYPDVRKKNARSFQQNNGEWKPFNQVKDQIGRLYFSDLLKTIEVDYLHYYGLLPGKQEQLPLNFYSSARLLLYMKEAQRAIEGGIDSGKWIRSEDDKDSLGSQWRLEQKDQWVDRSTNLGFSKEEIFSLEPNSFSKVVVGERGSVVFYRILEKGAPLPPPVGIVEQGHDYLSADAKRDLMLKVLQRIRHKKAVDLNSIIAEGPL